MIFLTLELISQLKWVVGGILLGDSFSGREVADLWTALCNGDLKEVRSIHYNTDIRCAFSDWLDCIHKDDLISDHLADKATL